MLGVALLSHPYDASKSIQMAGAVKKDPTTNKSTEEKNGNLKAKDASEKKSTSDNPVANRTAPRRLDAPAGSRPNKSAFFTRLLRLVDRGVKWCFCDKPFHKTLRLKTLLHIS